MEMGVVVSGVFLKKVGVYSFPTISFARLKVETDTTIVSRTKLSRENIISRNDSCENWIWQ